MAFGQLIPINGRKSNFQHDVTTTEKAALFLAMPFFCDIFPMRIPIHRYYVLLVVAALHIQFSSCTSSTDKTSASDGLSFSSKTIRVNGIELHYQEAGEGQPILFLHGGFGTGEAQFANQFSTFADGYRLIVADTRGHGESTFDTTGFTYELFAEDVYQLLEKLGLDSVYVVGFSDGGIAGFILASQHPEKVKKLVAIGANTKPDTSAFPQEAIDWVSEMNVTEMANNLRTSFPNYPNPEKLPEFVKRMQKLWLEEPNLTNEELQAIQCPTLLIAGEKDDIKVSHQEFIQQQIPNSKLHIIPNASHNVLAEKPNTINAIMVYFLSR